MIPFVGPSYTLANRKASVQRTVNMYLLGLETPSKAPFILQTVPGLSVFAAMGAPVRGLFQAANRCFCVAGSVLYELSSSGVATSRGTLNTSTGPVDFAWGLTQLVIVDGPNGYTLSLNSNTFGVITAEGWLGSHRVAYLDGYFIFTDPDTQVFYLSAIDDATTLDALDFASAESTPDDVVAHLVDHRELWLLGETTTEVWFNSGAADFPFARNNGASVEVGCAAKHSAQKIDSGLMWVGRDRNGSGMVYRSNGYQAVRVSSVAVEEALQGSTDLSAARAWVYQQNGQTFYVLTAPGLSSSWVYEVSTGTWHERAELVAGDFAQWRGVCHTYAHGKHLVGDDAGNVYEMASRFNSFAGGVIRRTRISPNQATPARDRQFFGEFVMDCTTGGAAQGTEPVVELSWSDDGGYRWGNPVQRSVGAVGEFLPRVIWHRLGNARDRVWRVDFTDASPFSIISAEAR